jgi:hypothetical protein
MCNVPEIVMWYVSVSPVFINVIVSTDAEWLVLTRSYHLDGIVKKFELVQTIDLPSVSNFKPDVSSPLDVYIIVSICYAYSRRRSLLAHV